MKFLLLIFLIFSINSCNYLEYDEVSYNHKDDIFNDFERSKSFLSNIYSYLPADFNSIDGAMRSSATDEAEDVKDLSDVQKFNDGSWSALQPLDDVWGNMYSGIRAANLFLKEAKGQTFPEQKYNDDYQEMMEQFNNYPYEARFLRAFFYFELIKRYKNVPLITDVLTTEESKNAKQDSFSDVVDFIVQECDDIAAVLPKDYANFSSAKETGRITKGAALALKARMLIYAASPLFSSSDDLSLWKESAKVSKDIIDLGVYSLESDYANIVNNIGSPELILGRRQGPSNDFEIRNFPIGFEGGQGGTSPTQNLVGAYEMESTGLPISDPASGYDPTSPYSGRDPRLNKTIILNNSIWKGQTVETFLGGANGQPKKNATETGYYLKKYVVESINLEPNNTSQKEHTWVLFRYGEVLLNFAEAMNEAYGPENPANLGLTARQAVNKIRQRAGMTEFPMGLSQSEFRKKLRNERRVELAFENQRFWDIRRWKISQQTTDIYKMVITQDSSGMFEYSKQLLENRVFEPRMYLYPISETELNKNPNLKQNPGW